MDFSTFLTQRLGEELRRRLLYTSAYYTRDVSVPITAYFLFHAVLNIRIFIIIRQYMK